MCRMDAGDFDPKHPCNPRSPSDFYYWETNYDDGTDDRDSNSSFYTKDGKSTQFAVNYVYKPVKPGRWATYTILTSTPKMLALKPHPRRISRSQPRESGWKSTNKEPSMINQSSILTKWCNLTQCLYFGQIPQIVIITAAEILFSITGYEFAYSQSAPSMKALVQALWLLTTAVGDSIIVLITALNLFSNMATEFFAYAGAMFVVISIFALMSIFYYEYNYYTQEKSETQSDDGGVIVKPSMLDDAAHRLRSFSIDPHDGEYAWAVEARLDDYIPDERF
ncbi:hypothetical protein OSTOST_06275 [Ostertagia ostertagi]